MNDYAWAGQIAAPLALAVGILACFWGYRILRLTLGVTGLIAGATGGWAVGLALAPGNNGIALGCAVLGGIIGAVLCIWLFFLGIFLLGASAGAAVAAAVFNGAGHQAQPILLLVFAIVFGILAVVLQKFMIIISTAFSGSYLITTGILHFVVAGPQASPLWFDHLPAGSTRILSYAALAFWLLLGLGGASFQYRGSRRRDEAARHEAQPA